MPFWKKENPSGHSRNVNDYFVPMKPHPLSPPLHKCGEGDGGRGKEKVSQFLKAIQISINSSSCRKDPKISKSCEERKNDKTIRLD